MSTPEPMPWASLFLAMWPLWFALAALAAIGFCNWMARPKPKGVDALLAEHAAEMDLPDLEGNARFYEGLSRGDRL